MRKGITEEVWNGEQVTEDQRFIWTAIVLLVSWGLGIAIPKTDYPAIDNALRLYTGLNALFIIHTQRKLSRFSTQMAKWLLLLSAKFTLGGIAILGVVYFGSMFVSLLVGAAHTFGPYWKIPNSTQSAMEALTAAFVFIGIVILPFYVLRKLPIQEMVFVVPRQAFEEFFIERSYQARTFWNVVEIEFAVIVLSALFSTVLSAIIKVYKPLLVP